MSASASNECAEALRDAHPAVSVQKTNANGTIIRPKSVASVMDRIKAVLGTRTLGGNQASKGVASVVNGIKAIFREKTPASAESTPPPASSDADDESLESDMWLPRGRLTKPTISKPILPPTKPKPK